MGTGADLVQLPPESGKPASLAGHSLEGRRLVVGDTIELLLEDGTGASVECSLVKGGHGGAFAYLKPAGGIPVRVRLAAEAGVRWPAKEPVQPALS